MDRSADRRSDACLEEDSLGGPMAISGDGEGGSSATASDEPRDTSGGCQPTLLGIPQELRDQIFGYVYATNDDMVRSEAVGILIGMDRVSSPKGEDTASIRVISPSPPSKDPLLICRQLYTEMAQKRTSAYRAYWTTNTFFITAFTEDRYRFHEDDSRWYLTSEPQQAEPSPPTEERDEIVTDDNMRHIHRFAFHMNVGEELYILLFRVDKVWSVNILLPEHRRRYGPGLYHMFPKGWKSENLVRTLRELNASLVGGDVIRDPSKGRGFNTFRLFEFVKLLQYRFMIT